MHTDNDDDKISGNESKVSVQDRRLDSLATLLTGGDVVAAICYDGEKFLLSNNNGEANQGESNNIAHEWLTLFSNIAKKNMTLNEIKSEFSNKINELAGRTFQISLAAEGKRIKNKDQKREPLANDKAPDNYKIKNSQKLMEVEKEIKFLNDKIKAFEILPDIIYELNAEFERRENGKNKKKKSISNITKEVDVLYGQNSYIIRNSLKDNIDFLTKISNNSKDEISQYEKKLGELYVQEAQIHSIAKTGQLTSEDFKKHAEKVASSLAVDGDPNKKFSDTIKSAFEKKYDFIGKLASNNRKIPDGLHGEMRLIQHLVDNKSLDKWEKEGKPHKIYIGVSKPCCSDCNHYLTQLNKKFKNVKFGYRGNHKNQYNSPIPPFVEEYELTAAIRVKDLKNTDKEVHSRENSDSEISQNKLKEAETKDFSKISQQFSQTIISAKKHIQSTTINSDIKKEPLSDLQLPVATEKPPENPNITGAWGNSKAVSSLKKPPTKSEGRKL